MRSNCPYCDNKDLETLGKKNGRDDMDLVRCTACVGFAVRKPHGTVFPLSQRFNSAADPVTRVIDG